jgi:hypothetical protein
MQRKTGLSTPPLSRSQRARRTTTRLFYFHAGALLLIILATALFRLGAREQADSNRGMTHDPQSRTTGSKSMPLFAKPIRGQQRATRYFAADTGVQSPALRSLGAGSPRAQISLIAQASEQPGPQAKGEPGGLEGASGHVEKCLIGAAVSFEGKCRAGR